MHPILFRIGSFPVATYALLALVGLVSGCAVFSWLAARDGRSRLTFLDMGVGAFLVALLSSKIFGAVLDYDADRPWESIRLVLRYGGHYYIGVIAGVTFLAFAFRRHGVPLGTGLDYLAPALSLAHAFGRIGCFFAGCCFGSACAAPWAVTFTSADAVTGVPRGVPLHPTQLYEAGAELLIFGVLLWKMIAHRGRPGTTFLTYLLLYGIARFAIEHFRADERGSFLGMPTSMPLALGSAVAAGALLLVLAQRRKAAGA